MTTLAANAPRNYDLGDIGEMPMIASEIIYEGAAVGEVDATGHARPLVAGDKFVGFAETKFDNSAGAAAAINVRYKRRGATQLTVTGAVITDVGQPVFAADDNAFSFVPTAGSFVGFVSRYVSAGVAVVSFDADGFADPYPGPRETHSANYTIDAQDNGKTLFCDTDAFAFTLPVTATAMHVKIVNIGAYGTVLVTVSPQAADSIQTFDVAAVADKDALLTKATARRGDYVVLVNGHADGAVATEIVGTWAKEA